MHKQFEWLWQNMDAPFRRRHVTALCICAFTCLLLLVNPALSRRLVDEVIMAGNPDPLLSILAVMLAVKLGREGLRYLMVIFLEKDSQNVVFNLRRRLFTKMQYNDMPFFDAHRTGTETVHGQRCDDRQRCLLQADERRNLRAGSECHACPAPGLMERNGRS